MGKRQRAPEKATYPKTTAIDRSQKGVFWRPRRGEQRAPENATHPKTQILNCQVPAFSGVLRFRGLFVIL